MAAAVAANASFRQLARSSIMGRGWSLVKRQPLALSGLAILGLFVLVGVCAPWLAPYDPAEINPAATLQSPSSRHWFGTTDVGRDLFSQVLWGTRAALIVGITAAILATAVGTTVGLVSGYFGGRVDMVVMRAVDAVYTIPFTPFVVVLVALLQPSLWNVVAAIVLLGWRTPARVIRSQVLSIAQRPYIKAARVAGAGHGRIMGVHILPNIMPLVMVYMAFEVGFAITAEASLSFLGLGDPRIISWGQLLYLAFLSGYIRDAWWWTLFPGLCITVLVLSVFMISYGLEEILNPQLRSVQL